MRSHDQSWGRFPRVQQSAVPLHWRTENPFARVSAPALPYGLGRSYGDSCLNDGGVVIATRGLDRFIALDEQRGLLACEAGVTLGEIVALVAPRGLFLPVVPGTKHVTLGGAIANDVHGKNHHRAGTFGCHVLELELLRSTGERVVCSPREHPALFAATVGGLGLTGIVLAATIQLRRTGTELISAESVPLRRLDDFFERSAVADAESEFTVAWIDCLARGGDVGRGILFRGNWAEGAPAPRPRRTGLRLAVPFELPFSPLNRFTLAAFNAVYYAKNRRAAGAPHLTHYDPFFFPLDRVDRWNRIYGRQGFLQFQCAIPKPAAPVAIRELLTAIARAREGSFLTVLKNFGAVPSPGLLSFPREGVTLALDFPNRGEPTRALFAALYATVSAHGGRLYPAKDALMPAEQFQAQYADVLPEFLAQRDPALSSSFFRRVMPGA
jgi:FAD/FMN-containing dehydrogenase